MRCSIALISMAGVALAANQTIPFYFPGVESPDYEASIVSANQATTTMQITCPSGTDASDCGIGPGLAYTIISSVTYQASVSAEDEVELSLSCISTAVSSISCYISIGGSMANNPGVTSGVLSGTDTEFLTATVTAGAELLSVSGGAQSTALKTGVSAGSTPTGTGASAKNTGSATGSAASASGTGAAYKIGVEGSAFLALAGVAAFNVL